MPADSGSPDVSVVIPVHNGANYVGQAIDSALAQTGVTSEIIVVDDASTDETPAVVRSYADLVRYLHLPKQVTSIATTNAGLVLCRGEFISILHHDDYFLPGKLAAHVQLMRSNPSVGLSYSAQHYIGPAGQRLWTLRSPVSRRNYVVPGAVELRRIVVQNYINFCNAVVRREAYESVGLYPEHLWFSAEWEMWIRLAKKFDVGYIDTALVCYRLHPTAQTLTRTHDADEVLGQLEAVHAAAFADPDLPQQVRDRERMSTANMQLSTALLRMVRRDWVGAMRALVRGLRAVRIWEIPELMRSSALIARTMPRLRLGMARQSRSRDTDRYKAPASTGSPGAISCEQPVDFDSEKYQGR
jgi:hypothetical protein